MKYNCASVARAVEVTFNVMFIWGGRIEDSGMEYIIVRTVKWNVHLLYSYERGLVAVIL